MKTKILTLIIGMFTLQACMHAQTACADLNGFVNYKDTGATGAFVLSPGHLEKAAQTYYYSGPGKINSVRIYGSVGIGIVQLKVGIYNVDATRRPTSLIQSATTVWTWHNNRAGYTDVFFGESGVTINNNFAVEVELPNTNTWGNSFNLQYTGDGEGHGEDLASLAGTYTGGNWTSALTNDNKDGDFYIVPDMTNFITSNFQISAKCITSGGVVTFTNTSQMTTDSMFNLIGWHAASQFHYFAWNFGDGSAVSYAVNPTHTFATAGVYTVSLTSTIIGWNDTCTDTKIIQISVGLAANAMSIVNATCNGQSNGSFTGVATGGAGSYSFSLSNETTHQGANFTDLAAGSYTLYVADQLGCTVQTPFTITQPAAITFVTSMSTNASCSNTDGGILVAATGGAGFFEYKLNEGSYQSGGSFSNIAAGIYSITARDTNECTAAEDIVVSTAGGPSLVLVGSTDISCNGGTDGSINVIGSGGSGALQYSINNGGTFQNSGAFTGLHSGNYAVVVKDAAGCTQYVDVAITQPQPLFLAATTEPTSCFGGNNGEVTITAAGGGTGSFTYSLDGTNYQSYAQFSGLNAGSYTAYVKDVEGCTKSTALIVTQPTAVSATATITNATCYESNDGSINVSATGGTAGYSFSIGGEDSQPTGNFNYLASSSYTITVTDANSCSVTVTGVVTQPTQVTATVNTTSATCGNSNGGILAVAAGGSGTGYMYAISSSIYNTTGLFNNLAAGAYYLIVADSKGCGNLIPVNIADANGPSITGTSHTNVSCNAGNDGTITVNGATGGTGNLQYSLNGSSWQFSTQFIFLPAGYYVVSVKDANGCIGTALDTLTQPNPFTINTLTTNVTCYGKNTGEIVVSASGGAGTLAYSIDGYTYQASNTFTNLYAEKDFIFVRDAAGCIGFSEFTITQPSQLNLNTEVLNVTCSGAANGAIIVTASGGAGNYSYALNNGGFFESTIFLYLSGGVDTVFVKDNNGCITSEFAHVYEPNPLITIPNISNVSCSGGDNGIIAPNIYGGTSPYTFSWSDRSTSQDQFNLQAGAYTVTVRDYQGCRDTSTFNITQPAQPLIVNGVVANASSANSNDGSVDLTVTGGDGSYTYVWSNNATTQNLSGLAPGNYSVNVKDANGCITTGIFYVSNTTSIVQIEAGGNGMTISPNPAHNTATVEANGNNISNLKVTNLLGQVVFESEPQMPKTEIQCNTFAAGVYLVEIKVNGSFITKRLVVAK